MSKKFARLSSGTGGYVDKEKEESRESMALAKKRVVVDFSKPGSLGTREKPHIDSLMGSSYHIAEMQLAQLTKKVDTGKSLSYDEMRQYKILTETLVQLAKEERAQDAAYSASEKSDEELVVLVAQAQKVLTTGDK